MKMGCWFRTGWSRGKPDARCSHTKPNYRWAHLQPVNKSLFRAATACSTKTLLKMHYIFEMKYPLKHAQNKYLDTAEHTKPMIIIILKKLNTKSQIPPPPPPPPPVTITKVCFLLLIEKYIPILGGLTLCLFCSFFLLVFQRDVYFSFFFLLLFFLYTVSKRSCTFVWSCAIQQHHNFNRQTPHITKK